MSHLIYRIETPEYGFGIYRGDNELGVTFDEILNDLDYDEDVNVIHQTPGKDSRLKWDSLHNKDDWYFGFDSIEQLCKWTLNYPVRVYLGEVGYVVRLYLIKDNDDIKHGERQIIFIKEKAECIDTLSLLSCGPFNLKSFY